MVFLAFCSPCTYGFDACAEIDPCGVHEQKQKRVRESAHRAYRSKSRRTGQASGRTQWKDHYEVLGVSHSATPAQIKRSFMRRAMKLHPDRRKKGGPHAEEINLQKRWAEASLAYEIIGSEDSRRRYDKVCILTY